MGAFPKRTLRDVDVKDQVVLVRADYNVPLIFPTDTQTTDAQATDTQPSDGADAQTPAIASDLRIRANLPTLKYLLEQGASKIVIISHLGRPAGKDEKLSLRPVALRLAELLPGVPVSFVDAFSGPEVELALEDLPDGGILLLENLRFSPAEEANSSDFAREIIDSTHATLFVQDGFGVVHRAHASTSAIPEFLPSVAGLLLEKEVTTLGQLLEHPERPFVVVIGGAKVADKQPLIDRFSHLADQIFVGGKIAADGYQPAQPLLPPAQPSAQNAPATITVASDFDADGTGAKLDIGPVSTMQLVELVQSAKTVLWNGVLGKVEDPAYTTSSTILAKLLGENPSLTSIICGGDTSAFAEELQAEDSHLQFTLVSTGGGAALAFLAGAELPGLATLEDR